MKSLVVSALLLGMSVANVTDKKPAPKAPVETFTHKYFVQVDKVNAALRDYTNTPCRAPEFAQAATNMAEQYNLLSGMYKNIPLKEDDVTRAHEQEVFLGIQVMSKISVDMQEECLKYTPVDKDPNHSKGD